MRLTGQVCVSKRNEWHILGELLEVPAHRYNAVIVLRPSHGMHQVDESA